MPGPHGFAVRFSIVRLRALDRSQAFRQPALRSRSRPTLLRPPHPIPTFVTMANAPHGDETAGNMRVIWVKREAEYFYRWVWTAQINLKNLNKFAAARTSEPRSGAGCREPDRPKASRPVS